MYDWTSLGMLEASRPDLLEQMLGVQDDRLKTGLFLLLQAQDENARRLLALAQNLGNNQWAIVFPDEEYSLGWAMNKEHDESLVPALIRLDEKQAVALVFDGELSKTSPKLSSFQGNVRQLSQRGAIPGDLQNNEIFPMMNVATNRLESIIIDSENLKILLFSELENARTETKEENEVSYTDDHQREEQERLRREEQERREQEEQENSEREREAREQELLERKARELAEREGREDDELNGSELSLELEM